MSEERRKEKKSPRTFMMRDAKSKIDEEAGLIFKGALPRGWVDNTLQKDYAKDQHIEITEPIVWEGEVTEKVTGKTIYVQRKGTEDADLRYGGSVVAFEIEAHHLTHWADETPLPVFLVVVDITTKKVYWLFIQRYLAEETGWRGQATFTVHIPVENELSDFPKFEQAVEEACKYMPNAKITVRERVNFQVQQLERKDPRFRVEPQITGQTEGYTFLARENVQGTLSVNSNNPSSLEKFEELIDKGRRVDFAPGELSFTGSPLFEEMAQRGGGMRIGAKFPGTVSLISVSEAGEAVNNWEEMTGIYEGGQKELRFKSRLRNSPLGVELRLVPEGVQAKLLSDLEIWINQRLSTVSYFDKTYGFFNGILNHRRLQLEGYKDGNRFFGATAAIDCIEQFRPIVPFLETMRKARQVARLFKVDPVCTLDTLASESLRDIEMTHDILFSEGGYRVEHPFCEITILMLKSEAQRFADENREFHDLAYIANHDEWEFMGLPINMGWLTTYLSNANMLWSKDEFKQRIEETTDSLSVSFGCSEYSTYGIRKATPEEAGNPPSVE